MDPEPKKISFGFSKLVKKPNVFIKQPIQEKKVELIECLEAQSIKIIDAAIEEDFQPLVIPVKDNEKNLLDRIRESKKLKERSLKKEIVDDRPDSELTPDELSARELLTKARRIGSTPNAIKVHTLPAVEDTLLLEGSIEPTLEDYDNVPISDYGLAMLRGMGWSEKSGIGKKDRVGLLPAPELRPKGMGLGANKMVSKEKSNVPIVDKDGKELNLIKGAFAKIIAGKEKGNYCLVQGLDDESGRVIVKTSLKGEVLSLNEFMLVPVTQEDYAKSSKVLNNAKYDEYKEKKIKKEDKIDVKENEKNTRASNKAFKKEYESDSDKRNNRNINTRKSRSRSRSRSRENEKYIESSNKNRSKSNDKQTENQRKRSSSNDSRGKIDKSRSSSTDSNKKQRTKSRDKSKYRDRSRSQERKHKKKSKKHKKERSKSSDSESDRDRKHRKSKKDKSKSRKDSSSDSDYDKYKSNKKHGKSKRS